jgi:arylsulfatase A-like enzyme
VYHHHTSDAGSWSEAPWKVRPETHQWHLIPESWQSAKGRAQLQKRGGKWRSISCESAEVPDEAYPDGQIAAQAVRKLGELKQKKDPFFMAVGFLRPHLPFNAPKKYWDMYTPDEVKLADNPFRPEGAPEIAFHEWPELRFFPDIPKKGPLSDEKARELIHAYYACTSYADAQVGKVLDELDRLGLAESTVVVLWGDHGWNLGEHGLWCKHSVFETSLRAPLIIRAPGMKRGQAADALVEFVDMYPTLADLCGLNAPEHLEGSSLRPLLENKNAPWKAAVFSRWQWGESIRTERYRYSEWYDPKGKALARMLYDQQQDPHENENIAEQAGCRKTVAELSKTLDKGAGWRSFQK